MKTSSTQEINFVPKGWGFEKWIVNCDEYCGKLLFFVKGKKCSWHFHKIKDEYFYVQSGKIKVYYGDEDNRDYEFTDFIEESKKIRNDSE